MLGLELGLHLSEVDLGGLHELIDLVLLLLDCLKHEFESVLICISLLAVV